MFLSHRTTSFILKHYLEGLSNENSLVDPHPHRELKLDFFSSSSSIYLRSYVNH